MIKEDWYLTRTGWIKGNAHKPLKGVQCITHPDGAKEFITTFRFACKSCVASAESNYGINPTKEAVQ